MHFFNPQLNLLAGQKTEDFPAMSVLLEPDDHFMMF